MNKKWKRGYSYALILALAFSGFGKIERVKAESREGQNVLLSDEKEVRVIVELEKPSIIEEANLKQVDYAELGNDFLENKKAELKEEQESFIEEVKRVDIEANTSDVRTYDTILNGVSLRVKQSEMEEISEMEGVRRVYLSEEYERPLLNSSSEMIGALHAWKDLDYTGEGTVVAVLDTGMDYHHPALVLDEGVNPKLKEETVNQIIEEKKLSGRFFTEKVPYGYNYYDFNTNLYDSYGSMHGMHVAGIVGANDKGRGIYGVAPNAQLLAMKVFSDDLQYPTTFTDVWLHALDDAISLGADVVNMSLGSAAGFSVEGNPFPEIEMIEKARDAGIVVAVAAGNDGKITDGNTYGVDALTENYDTSLVANPAVDEATIAVASMENEKKHSHYIQWFGRRNVKNEAEIDLIKGENVSDGEITGDWVEVTDSNIDSDFTKNRIKGNLAVTELSVEEGKKAFEERVQKIAELEPAVLVLYNSEKNAEQIGRRIKIEGDFPDLTIARMKRSTFTAMNMDKLFSMRFKPVISMEMKEFVNPVAGRLSSFSSWGPTPDLRMKPEVTAPGGAIYSTIENGEYGSMSGTSMASPQVAGASAILKQHIFEKKIENENTANFIKLLLMNTARPVLDSYDIPYFVRQQGSGAIHLSSALNTTVVVEATGTNDEVLDGKLELRELKEKRFQVRLKLRNFGDSPKKFLLRTQTISEQVEDGRRKAAPNLVEAVQEVDGSTIEIGAKETKDVEFSLDYTGAAEVRENDFVEGFISLHELRTMEATEMETGLILNIPFLGFYGNWNSQRAIDAFQLKEQDGTAARKVQFYVNKDENMPSSMFMTSAKLILPTVDNVLYFSPYSTYYRDVAVRIAPLRNMESIEYSVLDGETGETLRVLGKSLSVRKLNRLAVDNSFKIMPDSLWDGRILGNYAKSDKEYIYQMKVKLNMKGVSEEEQVYRFPIRVDDKAPEFIGKVELSTVEGLPRLKKLKFKVKDRGTGVEHIYLNSMKYVKEGGGTPLPPEVKDEAPGSGNKPKALERSEMLEGEKGQSPNKKGKPKYGKYLQLTLVDEERKDGNLLPKVENGKVKVDVSSIPTKDGESRQIFIYRNGSRNEELEIETPYLADSTHIYLTVKDYLSNKSSTEVATGEKVDYNSISFMNFYNSIKDKKAKVFVDEVELTEFVHNTASDTAKVKLQMPDDKAHLSLLYVKRGSSIKYLLRDDRLLEEAKKYDYSYDRENRTVQFIVKRIRSNVEIVTGFSDGAMPEEIVKKPMKLNLSKAGLQNFRELRIDNVVMRTDMEENLSTHTGLVKLEMLFSQDKKGVDVKGVILKKADETEILLPRHGSMDLEGGKEGYSFSKGYNVKVYYTMEEDASVEIIYAGSEAEKKLRPFGNDLAEDRYRKNSSKKKYPVIFLESPSLLSMIPNNKENKILVSGFVGNVKEEDEVEEIHITLVDKKGREIGGGVRLRKADILTKEKEYVYSASRKYKGLGYLFDVELPVTEYFTNIRIEAITKKGEIASIVRRTFYDLEDPVINYEINPRALDSDYVIINLHAKDESLRLMLFRDDSLVAIKDKTGYTLSEGGVLVEEELRIPLKQGQNSFKFKAIDLTGYKTEEIVNIFRTR